MQKAFSEADMYAPVRDFFAGMGYVVRSEVLGCDVAMAKDGTLIIVEMKKSFNMTLLYQAVDRLKITPQVYVAIPRPVQAKSKETALMLTILKKLEIGLIYVSLGTAKGVELVCFPGTGLKSRGKKRRDAVIDEMGGRTFDLNTGGQTRKPLATAYREKAVRIACVLEVNGALTASQLVKNHKCAKNTRSILADNHYGWFEPAGEGRYGLSREGVSMLLDESADGDFSELINHFRLEQDDT